MKGERTYWTADLTVNRSTARWTWRTYLDALIHPQREEAASPEDANLVCSKTTRGLHAPVLDIDRPHRLVPSSKPGHGHLYIDVEMPWRKYAALLIVMRWCRILERGFVIHSLRRGATFVRLPHIRKEGYAPTTDKRDECGCHRTCTTLPHQCEVPCRWPGCLTPEESAALAASLEEYR